MSESLEELLPCPFCGAGETHIVENGKRWNCNKRLQSALSL
jgi:hypothetical protein